MWSRLRGRRLGVAFRRQFVTDSFIVDFAAPAASLIVEVDGDVYHVTRCSADAARERRLVRAGQSRTSGPGNLLERGFLLYQKGWIADPRGKAKSMLLTEEGLKAAELMLTSS